MVVYENECVSCGLPCWGSACPNRNVAHYYCDECGEEDLLFRYNGRDLCKECLILDLIKNGDVEEL